MTNVSYTISIILIASTGNDGIFNSVGDNRGEMENEAGEYRPQCCDARSVQNAGRYSSIAGLRTLYSGLTHQRATISFLLQVMYMTLFQYLTVSCIQYLHARNLTVPGMIPDT